MKIRNPKYPFKQQGTWDKCPACFEHFSLTHCTHCGNGFSDEYIEVPSEIEQLRQRVQEQQETIIALNSCIGGEGSTTTENLVRVSRLEQRVAELEKERDDWQDEALGSRISIETLTAQRDALKLERDKATQYWQIAEGRCDALVKQRDELFVVLERVVSFWDTLNFDGSAINDIHAEARTAIASVKEKA